MDKPEINVESNLDNKNIREYLRNIDLSKVPKLKDLYNSPSKKEIDASKLSLETSLKRCISVVVSHMILNSVLHANY